MIAWWTLRARAGALLGTALAVALGAALLAGIGGVLLGLRHLPERPAERFATAPAVVQPYDAWWNPSHHDLGARSPAESAGITPSLTARVAAAGPVVADRTCSAQLVAGTPGPVDGVAHPWPTAGYAGYHLTRGRPPTARTDIAVPEGTAAPGAAVTLRTPTGPARYTVTGTFRAASWEHAVFLSAASAAGVCPRTDALIALGPASAVRAAVAASGAPARVLTGPDRALADPSRAADRRAVDDTATLLPVLAGVASTAVLAVTASAFALGVAQRRNELALLRLSGADRRGLRRLVRREALLLGLAASAAGAAAGPLAGRGIVRLLNFLGVAPSWFAPAGWTGDGPLGWAPPVAAVLAGTGVAVAACTAAAARAARIDPLQALREAAAEPERPEGRRARRGRAPGIAVLAGGTAWALWIAVGSPQTVLSPTTYAMSLTVPVLAAALLGRAAIGRLGRLLRRLSDGSGLPGLRRAGGATVLLAVESALAARRRTAAVAVPVLITVGLAGSLWACSGTLADARTSAARSAVGAPYALVPDDSAGVSPTAAARAADVPGVHVVLPLPTTVDLQDGPGGGYTDRNDAVVVAGSALGHAIRLHLLSGSLAALRDPGTMAVPDLWGLPLGGPVPLRLADGRTVRLRVAAVYSAVHGADTAYLPPSLAADVRRSGGGLAPVGYLDVPRGATAAVSRALHGTGARLVTTSQLTDTQGDYAHRITAARQNATAALVLGFCLIALLDTLLMSGAERRSERRALRVAGAGRALWPRLLSAEALIAVAVGLLLAAAATAVNLAALGVAAERLYGGGLPPSVPWLRLAELAGGCVVAALAASGRGLLRSSA